MPVLDSLQTCVAGAELAAVVDQNVEAGGFVYMAAATFILLYSNGFHPRYYIIVPNHARFYS